MVGRLLIRLRTWSQKTRGRGNGFAGDLQVGPRLFAVTLATLLILNLNIAKKSIRRPYARQQPTNPRHGITAQ